MVQGGLFLALVASSGCELDLEAGAPNHIDHTRVLGMRVTVAELAPIWPERVGVHPDDAPIVEALPGDRVRLAAILIAGDGSALPPEDHDAIWFQCDSSSCAGDLPRCEDLEWTSESVCELGRGGVFEFLAPPPGPGLPGHVGYMGIIAHDDQTDAEACRQGLLHGTTALSKCTIVISEAPLGPRWAMLHDAAMAGFDIGMPLHEIHWSAFLQPANRAPTPEPPTFADAATGEPLEGSPPRVRGGQQIRTEGLNWRPADRQPYVVAEEVVEFESYVFTPRIEGFAVAWFTAGPLRTIERKGDRVVLEVEEFADPGLIRAIVVFGDNRRAVDFRVLEFEVVP
jgi:hypothetical protein